MKLEVTTMLKTIITLGAGVALGCYYKSHKDKSRVLNTKKDEDHNLSNENKGKKMVSNVLK